MKTDLAEMRRMFLERAEWLSAALGDWVPPCTPTLREQADHALAGEIYRAADGVTWKRVDFTGIDWSCAGKHLLLYWMLVPLAAAFRDSGDERYALAARRYIEAFLAAHPITADWRPATYDGATAYPARIGGSHNAGWLGTLAVFLNSKSFDDDFFTTLINAARAHLSYLHDHIYPDRNIRVFHGDVLLLNGIRLGFLPEAAAWRTTGLRLLNDAVRRQILPDGAHIEAVPEYHCDTVRALTVWWRLARAMPDLGLHVPTERIAAMWDYALAACRPDNAQISLHDTGAAASTGSFPPRIRTARAAFRAEAGLPDRILPTCQLFPDAGELFLRDSWESEATYLTFDATTRRSWHWHPGRNAITLFANGRALLIDAGYPYQMKESYGQRTCQHSTLNLNGWNQSFSRAQLRVRQAPGYDLIEGFYDGGYWPQPGYHHGAGIYAEHHRTVLWIRRRCFVVLDHLFVTSEEGRKPTLESVWQLSEGPVTLDPSGRWAVTGHADSNLLMLFPLLPEGIKASLHVGERDPLRGWVPRGRRYLPAPMIRLVAEQYDPWDAHLATVLVPFAGTAKPEIAAEAIGFRLGFGDRTAGKLDLRWPDGSTDRIIWTRRLEHAIDDQHGMDTDAALVHLLGNPAGQFTQGLAVDGSYIECSVLGTGNQIQRLQSC